MYGARFAVFVRRARVLPSPSQATRNLSFLEVSPAPSPLLFSTRGFTGLVRVGLNVSLNANRTSKYAYVILVHEHVLRTISVFVLTGLVLPLVSCRLLNTQNWVKN